MSQLTSTTPVTGRCTATVTPSGQRGWARSHRCSNQGIQIGTSDEYLCPTHLGARKRVATNEAKRREEYDALAAQRDSARYMVANLNKSVQDTVGAADSYLPVHSHQVKVAANRYTESTSQVVISVAALILLIDAAKAGN